MKGSGMERFAGLALALAVSLAGMAGAEAAVRLHSHPMSPKENPDYARRHVRPPERSLFGNRYDFTVFRKMNPKTLEAEIDRYTVSNRLGHIAWPNYGAIVDGELPRMVRTLKERGLVLFDPWGYVPGNDDSCGFWMQFHVPTGTFAMLERELGDRWTGMDNGEQDKRYLTAYANRFDPNPGRDRFRHYLNFRRYFGRLERELGSRLSTLVGSTLVHSFLREGVYTFAGAETSQEYPNTQVLYSFLRGAGKQYGVPWFGNVSVYNAYGWKDISKTNLTTKAGGYEDGRADRGTSLALMKRLGYEQIFHNCWFGGMETGYFYADGTLTPIGRIQADQLRWTEENGDPGTMCTPVALMTDVFAGWVVPRMQDWPYADRKYRVWGIAPYEFGDYLTHGVYDLLYPGYADSHFFHDERGMIVPTPYGDIADFILSDAPAWLLSRYAVVVLAGRIEPSAETADALRAFVRGGGHLVMTRGNERTLFAEGFGDTGKGRVSRIGSAWGVEEEVRCALPVKSRRNEPFPNPHPLTAEARDVLAQAFAAVRVFSVKPSAATNGLSVISCRRGKGAYTVAVMNNTWREQPFEIVSHVGRITSMRELPTDVSERGAIGFVAHRTVCADIGCDTDRTIAAGAVRLFRVETDEGGTVTDVPHAVPPANPKGRTLAMNDTCSIREFVLRRPTFFRHWDGVKVSAAYLRDRDRRFLSEEGEWCALQGLNVMIDFTDLMNQFADLRLTARDAVEARRSDAMLDDILAKAPLLGVKEAIFALHATCCNGRLLVLPANRADFEATYRRTAEKIAAAGITAYLRMTPDHVVNGFADADAWVAKSGTPAFRTAVFLGTAMSTPKRTAAQRVVDACARRDGLWVLSAAATDVNGSVWTRSDPLAAHADEVRPYLEHAAKAGVRVVFDAFYPDRDAEYRDARLFEEMK